MRTIDIPREQVLQARIARSVIQQYQALSETQRAFLRLSSDPQSLDYEYNVKFLENYTKTYWSGK